jgi:hypothetical protein
LLRTARRSISTLLFAFHEVAEHALHQARQISSADAMTGEIARALEELSQFVVGGEMDSVALRRQRLDLVLTRMSASRRIMSRHASDLVAHIRPRKTRGE